MPNQRVPNTINTAVQFTGNYDGSNNAPIDYSWNHMPRAQHQWRFVDGTTTSNSMDSIRQTDAVQLHTASNAANTSYSMQTTTTPSNHVVATMATMATNAKRTFPDTLHQHPAQMQHQLPHQSKLELTPGNSADDLQQDDREGIKRRGLDHSEHGQIVVRLPGTRHRSVLNIPKLNSQHSRVDTPTQSFYHSSDVNSPIDREGGTSHDNEATTSAIGTSNTRMMTTMHPLTNKGGNAENAAYSRASSALNHNEHPPVSALSPNRPINDNRNTNNDPTGQYNDHAGPLIQSHRTREMSGAFSNYTTMNKRPHANGHTHQRGNSAYASIPSTGMQISQGISARAPHTNTLQMTYTTSQHGGVSSPRQEVGHSTNRQIRSSSIGPTLTTNYYNNEINANLPLALSSTNTWRTIHRGELPSILALKSCTRDEGDTTTQQTSPHFSTAHQDSMSSLPSSSRRNRMVMHDNLHNTTVLPALDMPIHPRGIRSKSIPPTTDERFVHHHPHHHHHHHRRNHSRTSNNNNNNNNDSHNTGDNNLRLPSLQGWLRETSLPLPEDVTEPMQFNYSQAGITTQASVSPMHNRYHEHRPQATTSNSMMMMAPTTIWHSGTMDTVTHRRRATVGNIPPEVGMSTRQQTQASTRTGTHVRYRSSESHNEQAHHLPRTILPRLSTDNLAAHSAQSQTTHQGFIAPPPLPEETVAAAAAAVSPSSVLPVTMEWNSPPITAPSHRHRVEHGPTPPRPMSPRSSAIPTSVHATSGGPPLNPVVPQMTMPTTRVWSAEDRRQMDQLHRSLQL
ncbi:hypothetical protein BDF22DRAFT_740480 [Syncephalis plumigaleata]|nr:hypothetical protein BDF22DRAFT_740480 [Syncephalis plumigaleata]